MFNRHPKTLKRRRSVKRPWYQASMAEKTRRLGVRLEPELLEKLYALAEKLAREHPGVRFTRSDVARLLLKRALTAEETTKRRR